MWTQPIRDELVSLAFWSPMAIVLLLGLYWAGLFRSSTLQRGPWRRVGIGGIDLAGAFFIFIGGGVLFGLVAGAIFGREQAGDAATPRQQAILAVIGILCMHGPVVIFTLVRAAQAYPDRWRLGWMRFGFIPRKPLRDIAIGGLAFLGMIIIMYTLMKLVVIVSLMLDLSVPSVSHELLVAAQRDSSQVTIMLTMLSAIVLAPFLEEIVFRGLLQTALGDMLGWDRRWAIILIASILFTAIHGSVVTWHAFPLLLALALTLGWLYERTGSLLPCIVLHMLFNAANVLLVLIGIAGK